ncbi:MAG: transcription elongation factor GreA [Candidatus Magasanikbacteria bacterium]|nr:transcription elongation factor GreA [Candidatus Magasanikbacteria bacterium]
MTTQYLTKEKYAQLEQEREELIKRTMPETAVRIDEARQLGDLRENAEYHAARERMAWLQSRVKEIDAILQLAEIVSSKASSAHSVGIGNTVVISFNGKEKTYSIVGAQEANPQTGHISNESPIGNALLGRKVGDTGTITLPGGEQPFEVLSIS